jgi:inosose dehydratase
MLRSTSDRRGFLQQGVSLTAALLATGRLSVAAEPLPNPVGYAAISWPQKDFSQALDTISGLGFKGVQLLGWVVDVYPSEKIEDLKGRLKKLNLIPSALSCSRIRLNPASLNDESILFRQYADFQKHLGGPYLQVTDGGRPGVEYSPQQIRALGEQMNAIGKTAADVGVTMGYHPHFGTLGETRAGMSRVLDATDPRYVKLIADVGHITLGGSDPVELIRTYHERLILTHFKDVRKDVFELARKDRNLAAHQNYHFCEIGQGIVDFPAIVQVFREVRFRGWVNTELDSYELRPGGPAESARMNKEALLKLGFEI